MNKNWDLAEDYIGHNKLWKAFHAKINSNTGKHYLDLWFSNAKANKSRLKDCGWACEAFQGKHKGLTSVLLGASPAIRNQVEKLRELQSDDFVFIGITSGLEFMVENGIKPKYVMIADADPKMSRFWSKLDPNDTKDSTLIASVCTHPSMLDKWKGDIKFLCIYTDQEKFNDKLRKWYGNINGTGAFFHAISSQYNTGAALSLLVFEAKVLIFVGQECGFKDREVGYYPDRVDHKDKDFRKAHPDIYGNVYYTNHSLWSLKQTLEDFLGKVHGAAYFFNCTEAGIFGVSKDLGNLPWIQQFTLDMGVRQARSIMYRGEPIYQPEFIQRPSLVETLSYGGTNVGL